MWNMFSMGFSSGILGGILKTLQLTTSYISQLNLPQFFYRAPVLKDKFIFRVGTTFKSNRKMFFYKLFVMDPKKWCVRIPLLTHDDSFLIGYKKFYRATIVPLYFSFSCDFKSLSIHSPYFWVRSNSVTVRVSLVVECSSIMVKTNSFLPKSFYIWKFLCKGSP